MKKIVYNLHKDGSHEKLETEISEAELEKDPLYQETRRVAEANPGFIACGAQAKKEGEEPGQITTCLIPKL